MAMSKNSRKSSAIRHSRAWISPRVMSVWIGIVSVAGVAIFAWHAQGQKSDQAPNTLRYLRELAAAKKQGGEKESSFEALGGAPQRQGSNTVDQINSRVANEAAGAQQQQPPPQQNLPPAHSGGPAYRVADRGIAPQSQGPALGSPDSLKFNQDRSILPPETAGFGNAVPDLSGATGSDVSFTRQTPDGQSGAPRQGVPAPVGGYGEAGRQLPPSSQNMQLPQQQIPPGGPEFDPRSIPLAPGERLVPNGFGGQPIPPASNYYAPLEGAPRRNNVAIPHAPIPQPQLRPGLAPYQGRPFANAGTGPTQPYGHGSYVNPGRAPHVAEYRLRVDDVLDCVYRMTRAESSKPYELNVGDTIKVESLAEPKLTRELIIQPDGTVSLLLLGQVRATRQTVEQLRRRLEELYREFYHQVDITITPLRVNTKLLDVINTVDSRAGSGGQVRSARVAPDGTISLPAVGKIPVQGMTLDEVKREIDARYAVEVDGVEVTPILTERAKRYVYVLGEVQQPGRYELLGPTNVMQAISLGGGWNVGANLEQVVIFRRGADWRIQAAMLDVWDALYGNRTCPVDDIWLSDSDVVIVPKMKILVTDDFINLIFTRGIYGVFPFQGASVNFSKLTTL